MRKPQLLVSALLLLVSLLAACAPKVAAPAPQLPAATAPQAPAPVAAPAPTKPAWETEWQKVVSDAAKEGTVVAYANTGEYRPSWSAAMKKYGVSLELIIGRGAESGAKIKAERRAGIYSGDVYTGGSTTMLTVLRDIGAFDPMEPTFILPEVKDPTNWYKGTLPFIDKDNTILTYLLGAQPMLAVNTNLVKPGEIKSWNDLLDPKWNGKTVMNDPTLSGTSSVHILGEVLMGWDYLNKLAATKPVILRDQHLQLDWLARGKAAIVLGPKDTEITTFRKAGAPIDIVMPAEGGYLSAGSGVVGLFNRAVHPNAAKLFVNWLLSKEGQTESSKAVGCQSARVDVPTDHLHPLIVRDPARKDYDQKETEEYRQKSDSLIKKSREVFKELLK